MGVLPASALARAAAFDSLWGVLGHSELKFTCVLLVVVLRLVSLHVVVILFIVFSDLLCLNNAHPYAEQASAAHQKLT